MASEVLESVRSVLKSNDTENATKIYEKLKDDISSSGKLVDHMAMLINVVNFVAVKV